MGPSPLAVDGKYIYAISKHVDINDSKKVRAYALETYELRKSTLRHVRSIELNKGVGDFTKFSSLHKEKAL